MALDAAKGGLVSRGWKASCTCTLGVRSVRKQSGPTQERLLCLLSKSAQPLPAGMLYLHTRSPAIYHRDLKSANLLVTSQYQVKVADFNLSRTLADSNFMSTLCIQNPRCVLTPWSASLELLGCLLPFDAHAAATAMRRSPAPIYPQRPEPVLFAAGGWRRKCWLASQVACPLM